MKSTERQSRAALLRASCLGLTSAAALMAAAPALRAQDSFSANASFSASAQLNGIDSLVAPIALYPDPLLGIVLPAATAPGDIQAAASFTDTASLDAQSWQPAVKDLAHYHILVQWMANNQDWTAQLGVAYADQPQQVFDSIQDLRRRAVAAGTLVSNDKIEVVQDHGVVQILPRELDHIYIPQYDAEGIFVRGRANVSLTFGEALPAGEWLAFYPVWGRHAVYSGNWYAYSRDHGGWHHDAVRIGIFGRVSGVSGSREFRISNRSQLKEGSFHAAQGGNYAKPSAFSASAGAAVGFQAGQRDHDRNSTFSGDQKSREQFNSQENTNQQNQFNQQNQLNANGRVDEQNREQQNRDQMNRDRQNNDQMKTEQQNRNPQDQARQQDEQRNRERQDQQRNSEQFRNDQNKADANDANRGAMGAEAGRSADADHNRDSQGQLQGDNQNRNQPREQNANGSNDATRGRQESATQANPSNPEQNNGDRNASSMNGSETDRNAHDANRNQDQNRDQNKEQNKDRNKSENENANGSSSPSSP